MKPVKPVKRVRLGLCGLGTVGSGCWQLLARNRAEIVARAGCEIDIVRVGARRDRADCPTGDTPLSRDVFELAADPNVDILIELIGGTDPALALVQRALANGKHVVTANKALIAEHGNSLLAAAASAAVSLAFEAAVGGGIPVVKALREGLAANRIQWLAGIINGTGNFILSEMCERGRDFAEVLAEAQSLGYAEADPSFDLEGIDAAHKLAILAAIAFAMPLRFDQVYTEGITHISRSDVAYAGELGYRIKHLGIARRAGSGIELRVHPTLIPERRLLANVNGVQNAVMIAGDATGPTLYCGAGAGGAATASAVLADVIDIARALAVGQQPVSTGLGVRSERLSRQRILPIEEVQSASYLRMTVRDQPGALSELAQIFSEADISIEALIQKPPQRGVDQVPVVILTNRVAEASLSAVLATLAALPGICGEISRIRVESLDG